MPPLPPLDHMLRVFSRLFPVRAAFVAIAGAGIICTGFWLGIFVWSIHRFISACGSGNDGSIPGSNCGI
ncbi:conserved hypothetical protein [Agrobacterium tumefaciens str. CFBP 5621]|nr:conserved hypothetical protein [Agrobacterium tumefaciens str. CFBP 5621]